MLSYSTPTFDQAAETWHNTVGQYGTIVVGIILAIVLISFVIKLLKLGSLAFAVTVALVGFGVGIPGWAALHSWFRTKGWA